MNNSAPFLYGIDYEYNTLKHVIILKYYLQTAILSLNNRFINIVNEFVIREYMLQV